MVTECKWVYEYSADPVKSKDKDQIGDIIWQAIMEVMKVAITCHKLVIKVQNKYGKAEMYWQYGKWKEGIYLF